VPSAVPSTPSSPARNEAGEAVDDKVCVAMLRDAAAAGRKCSER
jgi:hypothetical protein